MKYRVRKEDAERKLENTKKNLQRLGDILEELGNQVGPLEEQSTAAREYLRLRDELKEIEINVFLYQYDKLNERLSGLAETLAQLSGEIEKNAALEGSLGTDCAALEERERALSGCDGRFPAGSENPPRFTVAHRRKCRIRGTLFQPGRIAALCGALRDHSAGSGGILSRRGMLRGAFACGGYPSAAGRPCSACTGACGEGAEDFSRNGRIIPENRLPAL